MTQHEEMPGCEHEYEKHHRHAKKGCNINIYCGGDDHHDKKCCEREYLEVYSSTQQSLVASLAPNTAGGVVMLENTLVATTGLDAANAALGWVTINRAGWYNVVYGIAGNRTTQQLPLQAFGIALFNNGLLVPGSVFSALTLSPDQTASEIIGGILVHFMVGDKLSLANITNDVVVIQDGALPGLMASPNSSFLTMTLQEAD